MKKNVFRGLAVCGAVLMVAGSAVGCGGGGGATQAPPERAENTINIRAYLGGYGTTWLSTIVEKFNSVYAEEGYKVNLLKPSVTVNGAAVAKEMYSNDDWADIYYAGNVGLDSLVGNTQLGSGGSGITLVHDIQADVMEKPAIKFDGTEESKTIAEKEILAYDKEVTEVDGKRYALHSNVSVGGLLVNKKKLSGYGLEIPKTTNELIDCFNAIRWGNDAKGGSNETNQYPITYIGGDNGYHNHFYNAWVAQYEGADWWDDFWRYTNAEGSDITKVEDGWKVYEADGLEYGMEAMYAVYDFEYRAAGSQQNQLNVAHTKLMSNNYGAVFMADGDWAYNEILVDNKNIDDLEFMNIPVISALGTKLFGAGTSYQFDEAKCEEVLSWLIGCADDRKTPAETVALASSEKGWTLQEADVLEVMQARGVYVGRSEGPGGWWICNKTEYRDICNLFLRMVASEDAAVVMANQGHMKSAYSDNFDVLGTTDYWASYADIISKPYATGVWTVAKGKRSELNDASILPASGYLFANSLIQENVSAFKVDNSGNKTSEDVSIYGTKASAKISLDVTAAKDRLWGTNWNGLNK